MKTRAGTTQKPERVLFSRRSADVAIDEGSASFNALGGIDLAGCNGDGLGDTSVTVSSMTLDGNTFDMAIFQTPGCTGFNPTLTDGLGNMCNGVDCLAKAAVMEAPPAPAEH